MSLKSVFLRSAAAGAIVLSTAAVALPATAASATATPSHVSAGVSVTPAGATGKQLCTSNGVFCVQRVTSITNGSAYVDVWADSVTWTGWFALYGPDGHIANSANRKWEAGGVPSWLRNIPAGGGYYVIAWQNPSSPVQIGRINFSV